MLNNFFMYFLVFLYFTSSIYILEIINKNRTIFLQYSPNMIPNIYNKFVSIIILIFSPLFN